MPSLADPDGADPLFVDHVLWGLTLHLCRFYGGLPAGPDTRRPRLAPWQARLAKEIIAARLGETLTLNELAASCDLSVSHFTRAFTNTVGSPPYRWLLDRRLERATELLTDSRLSLAEVSLACGRSAPSAAAAIQPAVPPPTTSTRVRLVAGWAGCSAFPCAISSRPPRWTNKSSCRIERSQSSVGDNKARPRP